MRIWQRLLAAIVCASALAGPALAADELRGRYNGIADAEGASIRISRDAEGFSGTFFDAHGKRQDFKADKVDGTAEAVLEMDGRSVLMRMAPLPFGAEVALIPFGPDGVLDIAAGRVVSFVRDGLEVPRPPADYVPPPSDTAGRITAYSFLVSYEFWPPSGVVNGYLSLAPRHQTLIRLFPAVQLDVIWKLCLAPSADRALGRALRGQGVSCAEVLDGLAEAQRNGRFDDYKEEVTRQGDTLRTAVRCGDGYVAAKETCDAIAKDVSDAAVSLETAGTVLRRFR